MKIKLIRDIKVKTKLMFLGVVCILGLILVGVESVITARQINQASTDISQFWLPSITLAEELNTATSDYRIQENQHALAKDRETMEQAERQMTLLKDQIAEDFAEYDKYVTNAEDRSLMDQAQEVWENYLVCSEMLMETSRKNQPEKALELLQGESRRLFEDVSRIFLEVVEFNKRGAEAASVQGDTLYERLTERKLVTIFVISAVILGIVVYLIRSIEDTVKELVEGTRRAANGDLNIYLKACSGDEIGRLAESINMLIHRLNDIIKDESRLLKEIGNENYHARSRCEQAYQGDFAPILYAITSLQSRLEHSQININRKVKKKDSRKGAVIERIDVAKSSGGGGKSRI